MTYRLSFACEPAVAPKGGVHDCDGLIWYYDTRQRRTPRKLPGMTAWREGHGYVETTGERCACRCHRPDRTEPAGTPSLETTLQTIQTTWSGTA